MIKSLRSTQGIHALLTWLGLKKSTVEKKQKMHICTVICLKWVLGGKLGHSYKEEVSNAQNDVTGS